MKNGKHSSPQPANPSHAASAIEEVPKQPMAGATQTLRQHLIWIALLAVLTLAMFGDVLFTTDPVVLSNRATDIANQFIHWRAFGFGELKNGNLALWNPHIYSGAPYFGGFQSALLYPPNALFLFLPLDKAINWSIALHVFLAGAFTYAWAVRRRLKPPACFLSAVIYMFCGANFFHIYAGHLPNLCAMVWAPLLFLAIDGLSEKPSLGWSLLGVFATTMQVLAGHPQYVFYTAIAAAIYSALCGFTARDRKKFILGLAGIVIGGVGLCAVQLLTGMQESRETMRSIGVPYNFAAMFSFPPENFLTLLAPDFFGDMKTVSYWGRDYLWEMSLFMGVSGLGLAIIGAIWGERRLRRFSVTMIVLLFVLGLGSHTPLFNLLYHFVPGFNEFRGNSKFTFLASLFLALLAGCGLDELLKGRRPSRVLIATAAVLGLGLVAISVAVRPSGFGATTEAWWQSILHMVRDAGGSYLPAKAYDDPEFILNAGRMASQGLFIGGMTLAVVALLLWCIRKYRSVVWALLILAVVELFVFAHSTLDHFDPGQIYNQDVKQFLEAHPGDYRILSLGLNTTPSNLGSENAAMSLGVQDIWGYDPGVMLRYAQVLALTQGVNPYSTNFFNLGQIPSDHPLLRMLRCQYLFTQENGKVVVYERTNCLPHLLLVSDCRVLTNRNEIFSTLTNTNFNPRAEVILETEPGIKPVSATNAGTVKLLGSSTDWLDIEADVRSPAILLVTDSYAKGWRARALPGSTRQTYTVMPADWCLRGIPLAAGHQHFRLEYAPSGFRVGKWISLFSVVLFLSLVGVEFRRFVVCGAMRRSWDSIRSGWLGVAEDLAGAVDSAAREFKLTPEGRRDLWAVFGLVAVTLFVFWPLLSSDFNNYDDPVYVTDNGHVLQGLTWDSLKWSFTNLEAGFWHPLTWLSLILDATLFGKGPAGFHFTNLLLHLGSTAILFFALKRMTGALWRSAAVAALFAIHPLHVESVAWIAERKDVLSTFFWMLTMLFYARYAQSKIGDRKSQIANYLLALLFFVCGLMSKTMLVTLPAVLLLLDFWPLQRFAFHDSRFNDSTIQRFIRLLWEKVPFLVLAFLAGLLTVHAENQMGALPDEAKAPLTPRVLNTLLNYVHYIWQMIWPRGLAVFYPFPRHFSVWPVAGAVVLLLVASVMILRRWRTQPWLVVGWLWYVGTLLPVSGIIQVGSHASADRYTYVPLVGLFIVVVWGMNEWFVRWHRSPTERGVVAAMALGACALLTSQQARYWQNTETLFRHAIAVTKNNFIAYNNLGTYLHLEGKVDEAVAYYKLALQFDPNYADALNNLGYAFQGKGKFAEAIQCYEAVLQQSPAHLPAHYNLGLAYSALGKFAKAIPNFQFVLRYKPDNVSARFKLANALASLGQTDAALEQYNIVSQLSPNDADDLNNLGFYLQGKGQLEEALLDYRHALEINPYHVDALNNLGNVLTQRKQYADAAQYYQRALEIDPDYSMAHYNLGNLLLDTGKTGDAITQYVAAVTIQTNYPEAQYQLGITLLGQHKTAEGIRHLRAAVQLKPDWQEAINNLAWTLATAAEAKLRDGKEAEKLANQVVDLTGRKDDNALDTLAAAQAERGDFAAAVKNVQAAIQLAGQAGDTNSVADMQTRLRLYQSNHPYHETNAP